MTKKPEPVLWADSSRGVYIPQHFAQFAWDFVEGPFDKDVVYKDLSEGPSNEWYWDGWSTVLDDALVVDKNGNRYTLHQDGDLWLIPEGMEYDEDSDWFYWPDQKMTEEELLKGLEDLK